MSLDYLRTADRSMCAVTLTRKDGVEITVNRNAIAYVSPYMDWDNETGKCSRLTTAPVVNFGGQPDGGLLVQESYDDLRRLLRGEST